MAGVLAQTRDPQRALERGRPPALSENFTRSRGEERHAEAQSRRGEKRPAKPAIPLLPQSVAVVPPVLLCVSVALCDHPFFPRLCALTPQKGRRRGVSTSP